MVFALVFSRRRAQSPWETTPPWRVSVGLVPKARMSAASSAALSAEPEKALMPMV